jgi:hypothetical protein
VNATEGDSINCREKSEKITRQQNRELCRPGEPYKPLRRAMSRLLCRLNRDPAECADPLFSQSKKHIRSPTANPFEVTIPELPFATDLQRLSLRRLAVLSLPIRSGLFSLNTRRSGVEFFSFDYDPQSMACTNERGFVLLLTMPYGLCRMQYSTTTS